MKLLDGLNVINYGLVLIYGLFLSVFIAGGWDGRKERRLVFALCPLLILIQIPFWALLGTETVRKLYPLIVHLPLVLTLILALKKPVGVALVSVLTAYQCCQIPRWINLSVATMAGSPLAGEIAYTLCIGPVFYVMLRCFTKAANNSITDSRHSLLLFGSLPAVYYVFDYTTTVYSDSLYAGLPMLSELIPTALLLFYVIFLTVYHHENQKRIKAELETSAREVLLAQARKEMDALHRIQMQTAIYQHDMRHHLNVVEGFLTSGKPEQATAYIRTVQQNVTSISAKRFCGNDTVNMICSSYLEKAEAAGVRLEIRAKLPEVLPVSDTELCAILSNGLENALQAVSRLDDGEKWIRLYCEEKRSRLLIEIKNPYTGTVAMSEGLPLASESGHGLGCRSIRAIAAQHNGLCTFSPENGIFTMQVVLPGTPA